VLLLRRRALCLLERTCFKLQPVELKLDCLLSICDASAGAVELRNALSQAFGLELSATVTFDHPTIAALATHIAGDNDRLDDCSATICLCAVTGSASCSI
jgi:Phosphopantetheine attachment site